MSFSAMQLAPPILKAIETCGYTTPTPIQAEAIPLALAGHDLLATAQTGTGKTAAFVLPALQRLSTLSPGPKGAPRVLVLAPTRELADQVTASTRSYGRNMRLRSAVILGGLPYREQLRALSAPIDMVIGTPGRLIDHLNRGSLDLSRLELLILDEADRMLDMGFKEDVEKIVAAAPKNRQTLLFTATLDQSMARLAANLLTDPRRVNIAGEKTTLDNIEQRLHAVDGLEHKGRLLRHLIADPTMTQAIIFSATKRDADTLARDLKALGESAAPLHGDMNQPARNRTLRDLRQGKIRLLVATDVAARGIDVAGISHVINFDLPKFAEDYVHRIGRTGRAGASGIAISFASHSELGALGRIERFIGQSVPKTVIPGLEPTRSMARNRPAPGGKPARSRSAAGQGPRANSAGRSSQGAPAQRSRNDKVEVVYRSRPADRTPQSRPR